MVIKIKIIQNLLIAVLLILLSASIAGCSKTDVQDVKEYDFNIEAVLKEFPGAKFEDGKLSIPDVTFDELKSKFPSLESIDDLKAQFQEVELKMPDLVIEEIQKLFPNATLENGTLSIPDVTFDELKAKFPYLSNMNDLRYYFPIVDLKQIDLKIGKFLGEIPEINATGKTITIPQNAFEKIEAKFPHLSGVEDIKKQFPEFEVKESVGGVDYSDKKRQIPIVG